MVASEIPFENHRLEARAVDCASRLHHEIKRHEVRCELEIAAEPAMKVVCGNDLADASASEYELGRVGVAETGATANTGLKFPTAARERLHGQGLRVSSSSQEKEAQGAEVKSHSTSVRDAQLTSNTKNAR